MSAAPLPSPALRNLAMSVIEGGGGGLLDSAREVSRALRAGRCPRAVIGGMAVVLHGHLRTTKDFDLLAHPPLESAADTLRALGFTLDPERREFRRGDVVVLLVTPDQTGVPLDKTVEIDGIVTVRLDDLVAMKLRSGLARLTRAQDLADVIGPIRARSLDQPYSGRLPSDLRPAYRRLVQAAQDER